MSYEQIWGSSMPCDHLLVELEDSNRQSLEFQRFLVELPE